MVLFAFSGQAKQTGALVQDKCTLVVNGGQIVEFVARFCLVVDDMPQRCRHTFLFVRLHDFHSGHPNLNQDDRFNQKQYHDTK